MLMDADTAFAETLAAALPPGRIREDTAPWLTEPRGRWQGRGLVVSPGTTEEVATVVRACAAAQVPVIPYGGGTGLVGGQLTGEGPVPVILSLDRMTAIRGIWPRENVMEVEAGAVLADIRSAAEAEGRLFPLALASQGTARIGGLLATNAGGANVLRYGNARAQCLGVEVVTAGATSAAARATTSALGTSSPADSKRALMFSTSTMPMSTMVPIAIAIPDSAMMWASTPKSFMKTKAPITPRGRRAEMINEPPILRSITSTTRMVTRSCWMRAFESVPSVSRMSPVRS